MIAAILLVIAAAALAGVMTASIASTSVARDRTLAEQAAADKVESIRRLPYDQVGLVNGNPPGGVAATSSFTRDGLTATITTAIAYVNDPTPSSYTTAANYKKVVVTVTRTSDGKQFSKVQTFVAPPARAPYGGINNAIVNAQIVDYALKTPVHGASVTIANGPDPARTDTTDSTGTVSFAALTPNPISGPTAHYDISVSKAGYQTLDTDVPPNVASHVQLAPSQTLPASIQIFKPATIDVRIEDSDGTLHTASTALTVYSDRTKVTSDFAVTGGLKSISTLAGFAVVPGVQYTLGARTSAGLCASPAAQYVPDDYPNDVLTTTFTLTLTPCSSGTLAINVQQLGENVPGANVTVTGGPNDMTLTGTTDAHGDFSIDVPAGTGYTVTADKLGRSASTTATATTDSTTNVSITLPPPPTGTILVTATWSGPLASCSDCVTLSGGPNGISVTGSTGASGQVTFSNVPIGSGYTITATKSSVSGTASATVVADTTTAVPVALPAGTLNATVKWGGSLAASGASISIKDGPNAVNLTGLTANASGVYSATLAAGSATAYTIVATKAGQSVSATFTLTSNGSVATVSLNLPIGTLNATVRWGAAGPFSNGATITITGGPEGSTISGTTNAGGIYSNTLMPAGTGTYTITATRGAATAGTTFTIASSGAVSNVTLTFPIRSSVVITVKNNLGTTVGAGAGVTLVGGAEGLAFSGTTNASGQVTFTNVPAATNIYVAKAWNCASAAGKSRTNNALTITSGAIAQAVTMQYNSSTCPP